MLLTLYSFEGENLGYTDKVISSYQNLKLCGIGTSEFHLDADDPLYSVVCQNKHLILEENGFYHVVTGATLEEDFTLYCRTLNWLLSKVILPPADAFGTLSEVITNMLSSSYGGSISIGSCPDGFSNTDFCTVSPMTLSDALEKLLSPLHLGYTLSFDHTLNGFYLDIVQGKALDLYVCKGDETLDTVTLSSDILDYANSLCFRCPMSVSGEWEPRSNSPRLESGKESNIGKCYRVTLSTNSVSKFGLTLYDGDYIYCDNIQGIWKRSVFAPEPFYVYLPDSKTDRMYQWFYFSRESSLADARRDLANQKVNTIFSASAKNITFNTDYRLGDTVRLQYVQNNQLKTHLCQFTQVTLSRDSFKNNENPTLEEVE